MRFAFVLVLGLAAAEACQGTPRASGVTANIRLSFESPDSVLAAPPAVRGATHLALRLGNIRNASAGSFVIVASLLGEEGRQPFRAELGRISAYPANQPGLFRLRVPTTARAIAHPRLELRLLPVAPDRPLPMDLSVTIDSLAWSR